MSLLSPRTARLTCVAALTIATGAGAGAAAATVAKPTPGTWVGTNRTEFEIRGGQLRSLVQRRCGPSLTGFPAIKITAGGRFRFDKRIGEPDGTRRRYRVTGRFTSAFEATGKITSSKCSATFKAKSTLAPEPELAPEPAPIPDPGEPE